MNLLAPAALALAVVAAPIIAMYVLRMRRPAHVVPSTFLWEQTLRDMQANAPWQRLRPNLLLLLQLLAVAALVLALARPFVLRAAVAQGDVVAVLDSSALMSASDVAPSRFQAAKGRIGALIDGLGSNDVMSIILMARRPEVLIAQSADRSALHAALDHAALTLEEPDPASALSVAAALARGGRHAGIFVYTAAGDPSVSIPSGLPAQAHVSTLGSRLHDLGIVSFAASRAADGTLVTLTRVSNLGRVFASSDVQLDIASGSPASLHWHNQVDLHPVALAPGASTVVVRTRLPGDTIAVRARLTTRDNLAADDMAWAPAPVATPRRVMLSVSGSEPPFLRVALASIAGVQLETVQASAYTPASVHCADAAVFDGWLPAQLPAAPVLAVAPPSDARSPLGLSVARPAPADTLQVGSDPYNLLSFVNVRGVGLAQATPLGVPAWGYPVLRTRGQAVLVAGENPTSAQREAVLGFYLFNSNLGLAPDFPILAQNLLDWLAPPAGELASSYRPGDVMPLSASTCARGLTVTTPDRATVRVAPPFPAQSFTQTDHPGLYEVEERTPLGPRRRLFAVNLFPLPQVTSQGNSGTGGAGATRSGKAQVPVELAPFVAALALVVLASEWWVAARRR